MRIIFMFGTKSQVNADRLKEQVDDIEIEAYGTIREMMNDVTNRNLIFDRIVVSTASMHDETTMQVLHKFLRELHPRSTVVFIFKSGDGDDIARKFNVVFKSPLYTDAAIKTNSINLLEEISTESIDLVREKYSAFKYNQLDSDVIEDSYSEEDESKKQPQKVIDRPMLVLPQSIKRKKSTGLFGSKKLTKREQAIIKENLRLGFDYIRYVLERPDEVVKPVKQNLPQGVRKSMSNPVEEYKMGKALNANKNKSDRNENKNKGNLAPTSAFTQLELGFYGFSTSFDGRPMMFRTGISVTQTYNS